MNCEANEINNEGNNIIHDYDWQMQPVLIKRVIDSYIGGGIFQWDLVTCKNITAYMLIYETRRFSINLVIVTFTLRKKVFSCSINAANRPRASPEFTSIVLQKCANEALRHFMLTCRSLTGNNIDISPRLKKQIVKYTTAMIRRADIMSPRARSYSV